MSENNFSFFSGNSNTKRNQHFKIQISRSLQLEILSTLLLCDNIWNLFPQVIAHSFLEFSLQKIARRNGFCLLQLAEQFSTCRPNIWWGLCCRLWKFILWIFGSERSLMKLLSSYQSPACKSVYEAVEGFLVVRAISKSLVSMTETDVRLRRQAHAHARARTPFSICCVAVDVFLLCCNSILVFSKTLVALPKIWINRLKLLLFIFLVNGTKERHWCMDINEMVVWFQVPVIDCLHWVLYPSVVCSVCSQHRRYNQQKQISKIHA